MNILEAQNKLNWAIAKEPFSCEVIGYDSGQKNYKVKFKQEEVIIAIRDIPQEWINSIDPANTRIGDELKILFKEIDFKMNPFTW